MFFRTPRFIRRWLRRRMHPMSEDVAWSKRKKLSFLYNFIAWNTFGFVMYQLFKGNKHWPVTYGLRTKEEQEMSRPAYEWAQLLGIKQADVYRVSHRGITDKEHIEVKTLTEAPAEAASQ